MLQFYKNLPHKIQLFLKIVLSSYLLYLVVVALLLPIIIQQSAQRLAPQYLGEKLTIQSVRINPFTLTTTIRGFSLTAQSDTPIVSFEEVRVNPQIFPLFVGHISLKEVYVKEAKTYVSYLGKNTFNFSSMVETLMAHIAQKPSKEKPKKKAPTILVKKFTLENNSFILDFVKEGNDPINLLHFQSINFEINDFATNLKKDDDNNYHVTIETPLGAQIIWDGMVEFDPFASNGTLTTKNISIGNIVNPVSQKFPIIIEGAQVTSIFNYDLILGDTPHFSLNHSSIEVDSLNLKDPELDQTAIKISHTRIADINIDYLFLDKNLTLEVDSVKIEGDSFIGKVYADKTTNFHRLLNFKQSIKKIKSDIKHELGDTATIADSVTSNTSQQPTQQTLVEAQDSLQQISVVKESQPPLQLTWLVNTINITYDTLTFVDSTYAKEVVQHISSVDLELNHLSSKQHDTLSLKLKADINSSGHVAVTSKGHLFPFEFGANVQLTSISFLEAQPYLTQMSYLKIVQGSMNGTYRFEIKVDDTGVSELTLKGDTKLTPLSIIDKRNSARIFSWRAVEIAGLFLDLPNRYVRIKGIGIDRPRLHASLSKDGTINLLDLIKQNTEAYNRAQETIEEQVEYQKKQKMPNVFINRIALRKARADIEDYSPLFPFATNVNTFSGVIKNISTFKKTPILFNFTGILKPDGEITIDGNGLLLLKNPKIDITITTKSINLPEFTPYSATYTGLKIDKGEVVTTFHYTIANDSLKGENHIEVNQMAFGEEVESEDAMHLPFKLGVALLKDKNGVITLDVPVEGSLNDPEFKLKKVVWKAIGQILKSAIASPFRALGNLVHGGEDMDQIIFAAGDTTLTAETKERLTKIREVLQLKPEFNLEIRGLYQPKDSAIARRIALYVKIEEKLHMSTWISQLSPTQQINKIFKYVGPEHLTTYRQEYLATNPQLSSTPKRVQDSTIAEHIVETLSNQEPASTKSLTGIANGRANAVFHYLVDSLELAKDRAFVLGAQAAENDSSDVSLTLTYQ